MWEGKKRIYLPEFQQLRVGDYVAADNLYPFSWKVSDTFGGWIPLRILKKSRRRNGYYLKVQPLHREETKYFPCDCLFLGPTSLQHIISTDSIIYDMWASVLPPGGSTPVWSEFIPPAEPVTYKRKRTSEQVRQDKNIKQWMKTLLTYKKEILLSRDQLGRESG